MRAIRLLLVLTLVGFGIYMIVSPSNPLGPSGEDVKRETSDALRTTKDFAKGKVHQLKEDTKEKVHELQEVTKETFHTAKKNIKKAFGSEFSYDQKEAYRHELESQLAEWRKKCTEMEDKLSQEGKKEECYAKIENLKNTQQALSTKINEIPSVTPEKWDDFQIEVSEKMSSLENSYNDLFEKAARTGR